MKDRRRAPVCGRPGTAGHHRGLRKGRLDSEACPGQSARWGGSPRGARTATHSGDGARWARRSAHVGSERRGLPGAEQHVAQTLGAPPVQHHEQMSHPAGPCSYKCSITGNRSRGPSGGRAGTGPSPRQPSGLQLRPGAREYGRSPAESRSPPSSLIHCVPWQEGEFTEEQGCTNLELPPYRLGLAGCPDRRTTARRTALPLEQPEVSLPRAP